ncbi:Hypothetical predicted protein [Mytilus galloprovincialis]|uniref:Sex-determining region Y protein n=1 Tax=Mytilus galloprovincialis TaxID=29158 RepID=A0A8B6GX29_MYTGA|nr:Hypothetical predicted protein [Mytilus galloprovincialis]
MPPIRNVSDGRSFKESQPGQYIYDPMFCIHGDDLEDEESVPDISQLPFQSYLNTPQKNQNDVEEVLAVTPDDKKIRSAGQNKTPRTMMKMMERHRENERVRHHTLNKSMKKVCDRVPGLSPFMKETKVVMMQRIIAYICYLENTISFVCGHLGIKQLRMSTNFITEQWSEPAEKKEEVMMIKRKVTPKNSKKMLMEKRRQKISSPTIDSTTDDLCHTITQEMVANSQDSQGVSSTLKINEDIFLDDNACCVPEHYEDPYLNEDFLPSSSKLDNFPDAFDLMSSPLGKIPHHQTIDSSDECGIREDKQDMDICESPLRTISPDCVLATTLSQSSNPPPTSINYSITPTKYRNKRKQSTPQRSPFNDISNVSSHRSQAMSSPSDRKWMRTESKFSKECPVDEDFVSYEPDIYRFHKSSTSRRKKWDIENQPPNSHSSSAISSVSKVEKIDHRKTTWMNGFMMFSRLNRRSFIESNPGVHTSQISKMMGHAWRQMASDDQLPYREKAKDYASSMKNLLCDESVSSDDN